MPVYEYRCSACERVFEVQQKISDAPLTTCSECGGEVKKLVSAAAFHLKGGGWYADGYSSCGKQDGGKDKDSKPAAPACSGGAEGGCKSCPAAG
ncbi:hypothetical protein GCAAIG_11545 [Candidatus Electronema halotolerans]